MSIPPDTECGTECGSDVGADGRADWRTNLSSGYGPSRGRGQLSWEQLEDEAAEDSEYADSEYPGPSWLEQRTRLGLFATAAYRLRASHSVSEEWRWLDWLEWLMTEDWALNGTSIDEDTSRYVSVDQPIFPPGTEDADDVHWFRAQAAARYALLVEGEVRGACDAIIRYEAACVAADEDFAFNAEAIDRWRSQHQSVSGQGAWASLFLIELAAAEREEAAAQETDHFIYMMERVASLGVEEVRAALGPRRPGYVPPSPSYSDSESDSDSGSSVNMADVAPKVVPASPPRAKRQRRGDVEEENLLQAALLASSMGNSASSFRLDDGVGHGGSASAQSHVGARPPHGGGAEQGDPVVDRGPYPCGVETIQYTSTELGAAAAPSGSSLVVTRPTSAGGLRAGSEGDEAVVVIGGLVSQGMGLAGAPLIACDAAALRTPAFASMRNLRAESTAALLRRAIPGALHEGTPRVGKPPRAKRPKGQDLPTDSVGGEEECDAATEWPVGPIHIRQTYASGCYDEEIVPKLAECEAAAYAAEHGLPIPSVATLVVPNSRRPAWARPYVFDATDVADCRVVQRSTRDTVFPGKRQLDRAAFRAMCGELGWDRVNPRLVATAGEGGLESGSTVAHDTVIAFHHKGFLDEVAAARKALDANLDEEWASVPSRHLPFSPCRVNPRNIIMQGKDRVLADGVTVEHYMKPRATSNTSYGGARSINGCTEAANNAIGLPSIQEFGVGMAIVAAASDRSHDLDGFCLEHGVECPARASDVNAGGADYEGSGQYAVDAESAYSFMPMQRDEWWKFCFYWWRGKELKPGVRPFTPGVSVSGRLEFGGAFAPKLFCDTSVVPAAYAQAAQARFDEQQPYPPHIESWGLARGALQRKGELPQGAHQRRPAHLQVFVDDFMGAATKDRVVVPREVRALDISSVATVAFGGTFPPRDSRLLVHAGIVILSLRRIGLSEAGQKTVVGDPIGSLGFEMARAANRMRCTAAKRDIMLADIASQKESAIVALRVECPLADKLVGRFCNLSQIYPEIRPYMFGGYRVLGRWMGKGGRFVVRRTLELKAGRNAQVRWLRLLDIGHSLLTANEGVPLAARLHFVPRSDEGVYTSTTDASGIDGVGGYVFVAGRPHDVWLVSEKWPKDIQLALDAAGTTGEARARLRDEHAPMLAMPAAELFGCVAVPQVVAETLHQQPVAIYAVGDCLPAACTLTAGVSGSAQMRTLLEAGRRLCDEWAGVAVRREHNTDADRLSHPAMALEVAKSAADAGLIVHEARIPPDHPVWDTLRQAAAEGLKGADNEDKIWGSLAGTKRGGFPGERGAPRRSCAARGASSGGHPPLAPARGVSLDLHQTDIFTAVGRGGICPRKARVALVIFAADDERPEGLPAQLRERGFDTIAVDTKIAGDQHNVLSASVRARVAEWLASGVVVCLFMAPPCESFSVAHRPQLRSARQADGILPVPPPWAAYLLKHNALASFTCDVARIADAHHVPWMMENPADRGIWGTAPWWHRMRDHGSIWRFSATRRLVASVATSRVTFAQCMLEDGAVVQKYTTLLYAAALEAHMGELRSAQTCTHSEHAERAHGRDGLGRGRAELAAAYPLGLSRAVARAFDMPPVDSSASRDS